MQNSSVFRSVYNNLLKRKKKTVWIVQALTTAETKKKMEKKIQIGRSPETLSYFKSFFEDAVGKR